MSDSEDHLKHIVGFDRKVSACSDASTEIQSRQVTGSDVSTDAVDWILSRQASKQSDGSLVHFGRVAPQECNEPSTASLVVQEPVGDAMRHKDQAKLDSLANAPALFLPDARILCDHAVPQKASSMHVLYTAGSSLMSSVLACFTCITFVLHSIAQSSKRSCDDPDSDDSDNDFERQFQWVHCDGEKAHIFQWEDEDGELQWAYVDASGKLIT